MKLLDDSATPLRAMARERLWIGEIEKTGGEGRILLPSLPVTRERGLHLAHNILSLIQLQAPPISGYSFYSFRYCL